MRTSKIAAMWRSGKQVITKVAIVAIVTVSLFLASDILMPQSASAYPFWAQQTAPDTPREATGRIVCANCHLAEKAAEIEIPHSILPNKVFDAVVKMPYDREVQEVMGDGSKGDLQVGAVLMLPEGFKIAPEERIPEELKEKVDGLFYQQYRQDDENVYIVGPLPGKEYAEEIHFPILSPDPNSDKNINFGKYAVHLGVNLGRGQTYPTGDLTNNNQFKATAAGTITSINNLEFGGYEVTINTGDDTVVETIPAGVELVVSVGQEIAVGEALSNDPNVGGFGQKDTEIVLQSSTRIGWMVAFVSAIMLAQMFLVLKKKQVERVQAAEMNF